MLIFRNQMGMLRTFLMWIQMRMQKAPKAVDMEEKQGLVMVQQGILGAGHATVAVVDTAG